MKRLIRIVIICILYTNTVNAQQISHKELNISIREGALHSVLKSLSDENQISFSYASNVIDENRIVRIPKTLNTLHEILPHLFEVENFQYKIQKQKIILYREQKTDLNSGFIHLKAILIDDKSGKAIAFGAIQVKGKTVGTSSNLDGVFELKLNNKYVNDTLIFSCLGYSDKELPIHKFISEKLKKIKLEANNISIEEVNIKPIPAVEIVKEAIAAIPSNYSQNTIQFDGFYRSLIQKDGKYVRMLEAACKYQSDSYTGNVDKYERQKEYFNFEKYRSYWNVPRYGFLQELYDLHVAKKDKILILESRISKDHTRDIEKRYYTGGPLSCLACDKVKLQSDFLNPNKLKAYQFKYKGVTQYMNRDVYIISFSPQKRQKRLKGKDYRKKMFGKVYKNADMSGELYIDTKSMAFVRLKYKLNNDKLGFHYDVLVDYKQINNKWYLSNVDRKSGTDFKAFKRYKVSNFYWNRSILVVSNIDTLAKFEMDTSLTKPYFNRYSAYLDAKEYNPEFWQNYSSVSTTKDEQKIIADLEKQQSLENQFQLTQKFDSSLCFSNAIETPVYDTIHGNVQTDLYPWLENKYSDTTVNYLADQNSYTDNYRTLFKKEIQGFNDRLGKWFHPRINHSKILKNNYIFYEEQNEYEEFPRVFRKLDSAKATAELILDVNEMAKNKKAFDWGGIEVSPSGEILIISSDTTGAEDILVQFKNLKTGTFLKDSLQQAYFIGWNANETEAYYIRSDSSGMQNKLYKHRIGTNQDEDILLFNERREKYNLLASKADKSPYIFLSSKSYVDNEINLYNSETHKIIPIFPLKKNQSIHPKIIGNNLYAHIELDTLNYIIQKSLNNNKQAADTVYSSGSHFISDFTIIDNVLFCVEVYNAQSHLKKIELKKKKEKLLGKFQYCDLVGIDQTNKILEYTSESLKYGKKRFQYSLKTGKSELIEESFKPGEFNESNYIIKKLQVKAKDGAIIPLSICYHKKTYAKLKKQAVPLLLKVYGHYGFTSDLRFKKEISTLLDMGWAYAIAHVRGGRDNGSDWFKAGNKLNKRNSLNDLIDCANYLIDSHYTSSQQMALDATSAGGITAAYTINNYPELFSAVLMKVPAIDLISIVQGEKAEQDIYGNPDLKEQFDYINSYSPIANVKAAKYPSVLITCGYNDSNVPYWHAAKYVALLQKYNTGNNPVLLKTYLHAGHGLPSGRISYNQELSFQYGFLKYEIERKK